MAPDDDQKHRRKHLGSRYVTISLPSDYNTRKITRKLEKLQLKIINSVSSFLIKLTLIYIYVYIYQCVCMYIYMFVYIYIYIYIYISMCTNICVCVYVCISIYVYILVFGQHFFINTYLIK